MNTKGKTLLKKAIPLGLAYLAVRAYTDSESRSANIIALKPKDGPQGPQGPQGEPGPQGETGPQGPAGNQIQNFGGSILVNGAGELGTTQNWDSGTSISFDSLGFAEITFSNTTGQTKNNTLVIAQKKRLYALTFDVKSANGSGFLFLAVRYKKDGTTSLISGTSEVYPNVHTHTNIAFEEKNVFFGGPRLDTTFALGDAYSFKIHGRGLGVVKNLILRVVDLAEPVPYNLVWLPPWQMVYDPVTNELGRYNGTTVDWFTMQP